MIHHLHHQSYNRYRLRNNSFGNLGMTTIEICLAEHHEDHGVIVVGEAEAMRRRDHHQNLLCPQYPAQKSTWK
jgi:hypothetical protein